MDYHSRTDIATTVLLEALHEHTPEGHVLLVEDYTDLLVNMLESERIIYHHWNRHYHPSRQASPWPPQHAYGTAIIRLPKSHAAFDMILHAAAQYLLPDAHIIVYGFNDEGIKGAKKKVKDFFGNVETLLFKKRCHVISAQINEPINATTLTDFEEVCALDYNSHVYKTTFYPGMFAAGTLDEGTQLLLDAVRPCLRDNVTLLDYGCGSGIITHILQKNIPSLQCDILDNDVISLAAAKKNCTNVRNILADSLKGCDEKKYDVIISNPPMHTEKTEHLAIIENLIASAPHHLSDGGQLIIVVQSRFDFTNLFHKNFSQTTLLAHTSQYTVIAGTK